MLSFENFSVFFVIKRKDGSRVVSLVPGVLENDIPDKIGDIRKEAFISVMGENDEILHVVKLSQHSRKELNFIFSSIMAYEELRGGDCEVTASLEDLFLQLYELGNEDGKAERKEIEESKKRKQTPDG